MIKNKKVLVVSSLLALVLGGTAVIANGHQAQNIETMKSQSAKLNRNKEEKDSVEFKYVKTYSGGTSSALVAYLDGVQHVFAWGNNELGQLGVGTYGQTSFANNGQMWDAAYFQQLQSSGLQSASSQQYPGSAPVQYDPYINLTRTVPTPEDINIDGGMSGIQGNVLDVVFGDATTYAIIEDEEGYVNVYAAGSNVYGQLGDGSLKDPVTGAFNTEYNMGIGYRPSWEKIEFKDKDGVEVKFTGYNDLAAAKATYFSAVDEEGNNRVFSWGVGTMGQLGNGAWSRSMEPPYFARDVFYTNSEFQYGIIDTPEEITNQFLLPTYSGATPEGQPTDPTDPAWWSGYGISNSPKLAGSAGNYNAIDGSGSLYNDPSTRINTDDLSYPFSVEGLNSGSGWQITEFLPSKHDVTFVAESQDGKRALLGAGQIAEKYPSFAIRGTTVNGDGIVVGDGAPTSPANFAVATTSIPILWFWDGIPLDIFLSDHDTFAANGNVIKSTVDYSGTTDVKLIDVDNGLLNTSIALRIDGIDHMFSFNVGTANKNGGDLSDKRRLGAPAPSEIYSSNPRDDGNGYAISFSSQENVTGNLSEVELGYNVDGVDGVSNDQGGLGGTYAEGWEIIKVFNSSSMTLPMSGALIKTPNESSTGPESIYSLVGWGANNSKILNPNYDESGYVVGQYSKYHTNTTLFFTTASSKDQIASNSLLVDAVDGSDVWARLSDPAYARTIDNYMKSTYTTDEAGNWIEGESLYQEGHEYVISDVVVSGTSVTVEVYDDLDKSGTVSGDEIVLRYSFGDNTSKQISTVGEIDSMTQVRKPTALDISATPISDSFAINYGTSGADGLDFSLELVHGDEFEKFFPELLDAGYPATDSIRLYGDINDDGFTDVYGASPEYIGSADLATGSIQYLGYGEATGVVTNDEEGYFDLPTYVSDPITYNEQEELHKERYHFRIRGLDEGTAYTNLYVSVNQHNPISVQGVLQTTQKPKFTQDPAHITLDNVGEDFVSFTTEFVHDVSGFEPYPIEVTPELILGNTIVSFEDPSGNLYSTNTDLIPGTPVTLSVDSIDETFEPNHDAVPIGETPTGQDVKMTITGLPKNTEFSRIKFYYDSDNVDGFQNESKYKTDLPSTSTFITKQEFVIYDGFTPLSAAGLHSGDFLVKIDEGDETYGAIDPESLVVTANESTDGAAATSVEITSTLEVYDAAKNEYKISMTDLKSNTAYSDFSIEIWNEGYGITPSYSKTMSDTSGLEITSPADQATIDKVDSNLVADETTNNSLTVSGLKTIEGGEYGAVLDPKVTATISGTNEYSGSVAPEVTATSVVRTTDGSKEWVMQFDGLEAKTHYTSITVNLEDELGLTDEQTFEVDFTTLPNDLIDGSIDTPTIIGTPNGNGLTIDFDINDYDKVETIDTSSFGVYSNETDIGTNSGILLIGTAMNSSVSITPAEAIEGATASVVYDELTGHASVEVAGLTKGVHYKVENIQFKDNGEFTLGESNLIEMYPPDQTDKIEFDVEADAFEWETNINMSSHTLNEEYYTTGLLTIDVDGFSHSIEEEAIDMSLITGLRTDEGDLLSASVTGGEITSGPTVADRYTYASSVFEVTVPEELLGSDLNIVKVEYEGSEYSVKPYLVSATKNLTIDDSLICTGTNFDTITSQSDIAEMTLDLEGRETLDSVYVDPTMTIETATIVGSTTPENEYVLNDLSVARSITESATTYEIIGYTPVIGEFLTLTGINGTQLSAPIDLGVIGELTDFNWMSNIDITTGTYDKDANVVVADVDAFDHEFTSETIEMSNITKVIVNGKEMDVTIEGGERTHDDSSYSYEASTWTIQLDDDYAGETLKITGVVYEGAEHDITPASIEIPQNKKFPWWIIILILLIATIIGLLILLILWILRQVWVVEAIEQTEASITFALNKDQKLLNRIEGSKLQFKQNEEVIELTCATSIVRNEDGEILELANIDSIIEAGLAYTISLIEEKVVITAMGLKSQEELSELVFIATSEERKDVKVWRSVEFNSTEEVEEVNSQEEVNEKPNKASGSTELMSSEESNEDSNNEDVPSNETNEENNSPVESNEESNTSKESNEELNSPEESNEENNTSEETNEEANNARGSAELIPSEESNEETIPASERSAENNTLKGTATIMWEL